MRKTLTVNVTQSHIDRGEKRACKNCPVAIALRETLGVNEIHAGPNNILIGPEENCLTGRTSITVRKFMEDFDEGNPVVPFSFELTMPE